MGKGYRNIDPSVKEEYLEWLMTPPSERDPATKQEMAEYLNVAPSTLWGWEQTPEFQQQLRLLKSKWGTRFHGDILGRLMKIVTEGTDTAAIQASKVLLLHLDTGARDEDNEGAGLDSIELEAIRKALNDKGYVTSGDE